MAIIKNSELRGILGLVLIIALLGGIMAYSAGKFEQWFGLFAGPRITDSILFVSDRDGANDVYSMKLDGKEQTRLTEQARVISSLAINPAGNRIGFLAMPNGPVQVYSIGGRGGRLSQITSLQGNKGRVSYLNAGNKMCFVASGRVYTADLNGDNPEPVLPTGAEIHGAAADPLQRSGIPIYRDYAWSPDRKAVMGVTRNASGNDELVFVQMSSDEQGDGADNHSEEGKADKIPIPGKRVRIAGMAWAAKKNFCAISVAVDGRAVLLILDLSQKQFAPLALPGATDVGSPAISSDGNQVVVPIKTSGKKGINALLRFAPEQGGPQIIQIGEFENPSFSPNGKSLLATRIEGGKKNIVKIDTTNGKMKQLTTDGNSFNAIWTPESPKK